MCTQDASIVTNFGEAVVARTVDKPTRDHPLELLANITERSPLPMLAAEGPTHIVRYVNPAFCRLFGKAKEELMGHPVAQEMPELLANGCIALLDRVLKTEDTDTLADQEHAVRPSGVYWSYTAWAILAEAEHPAGVTMMVMDTTEAARARQKIGAMNEALLLSGLRQQELTEQTEDLNERLQRAFRETYHRVKNNLQVVAALAEMQVDRESPTVPASALQRIAWHVRTLATLHDVLTRQVRDNTENTSLDTRSSLHRLLTLLQESSGTRHLHYEVAQIMLSLEMSASLSLLVSELVSNALKHGEGAITITLQRSDDEALLTVHDEGQGFPADFEPNRSAHTGLELIDSLVRHDLHGTIQFTNTPEGGASILVTFPLPEM